jgi:hypothetical protein
VAGEHNRDGKPACHQGHRDAEADNQPLRYPRGFPVVAAGSVHRSTLLNNPAKLGAGRAEGRNGGARLHDACREKCNRDNGSHATQAEDINSRGDLYAINR